jgi:hypothetical protein
VKIDRAHHARHHDHEPRLLLIVLAGGEQIVTRGRVKAPVAVLAGTVDALGKRRRDDDERNGGKKGATGAEESKHAPNVNTYCLQIKDAHAHSHQSTLAPTFITPATAGDKETWRRRGGNNQFECYLERLLVEEHGQSVFGRHVLHDTARNHVLIGGHIGQREDGRQLVLAGRDLWRG